MMMSCQIAAVSVPNAKLPQSRSGRPAAGRPAPRDLRVNIFAKIFAQKSLPPGSRAAGVYSCKFRKRKYIFVKNENKK